MATKEEMHELSVAAKMNIEKLLGVKINSCGLFRKQTR